MIEDISYGIIPFWRDQQDMIRFLLIYQKEGFWGFPKGHKEGNESDIDAAKRELQEETWLSHYTILNPEEPFQMHYQFKNQSNLINKTVIFYVAELEAQAQSQVQADAQEVIKTMRALHDEVLQTLTHQSSKDCFLEVWQWLKKQGK